MLYSLVKCVLVVSHKTRQIQDGKRLESEGGRYLSSNSDTVLFCLGLSQSEHNAAKQKDRKSSRENTSLPVGMTLVCQVQF